MRIYCLLIILFYVTCNATSVTSVFPEQYQLNVDPLTEITITFDDPEMDPSTMNNQSIKIHGSHSTYRFDAIDYDGASQTVTLVSDKPFLTGEQITIIVTDQVENESGLSVTPFYWTFTINVPAGTAEFYRKDIQNLGRTVYNVHAGDMDHDGDLDLTTVLMNSKSISVLKNDGHGLYSYEPVADMGSWLFRSVLGDLDNDGDLDLAAGARGDTWYGVQLFFNDGAGVLGKGMTLDLTNYDRSVVAADMDLDGDLDLAFTVQGEEKLHIYENYTSGNFSEIQNLSGFSQAQSISPGDYDNDGQPELMVTDTKSNEIIYFENNGNWTFTKVKGITAEEGPFFCTNGDLNSDGWTDLVVAHYNTNKISIYGNDGSVEFSHLQIIDVGATPDFAKIADIDGDGHPDILVPCRGSNTVDIIRNNGNNTFTNISSIPVWTTPSHLTTADIDYDGDLDMAVANMGSQGYLSHLSLLRNRTNDPDILLESYIMDFGSIGIGEKKTISCKIQNISLESNLLITEISTTKSDVFSLSQTAGTILPDQALYINVSFTPDESISYEDTLTLISNDPDHPVLWIVLSGSGFSGFSPSPNMPSAMEDQAIFMTMDDKIDPKSLQTNAIKVTGSLTGAYMFEADYDSSLDQVMIKTIKPFRFGEKVKVTATDLIKLSNGEDIDPFSWSFTVRTTKGNGLFSAPEASFPYQSYSYETAGVADLNSDGRLDVVGVKPYSRGVEVFLNQGGRRFSHYTTINVGYHGGFFSFNDIDNDSDTDLLIGGSKIISIFSNSGSATFSLMDTILFSASTNMRLFLMDDWNNDGLQDFAVAFQYEPEIAFYQNEGDLTFNKIGSVNSNSYGYQYTSCDWDGDGDADMISAADLHIHFIENNQGSFSIKQAVESSFRPHGLSTGDFNFDGALDVAMAGVQGDDRILVLYFNDGTGQFIESLTKYFLGLYTVTTLTSGDFDHDGDLDIAIGGTVLPGYTSESFAVYFNNGNGVFTKSIPLNRMPAESIQMLQAADFDGNGSLEILMVAHDNNKLSMMYSSDPAPVYEEREERPIREFVVYQNFPNPFNPGTTIRYTVPSGSSAFPVKVTVYDIMGRLVQVLVNKSQQSGNYSIKWNGTNTSGLDVPSGVYFCLIRAGDYTASRKMLLIR